MRFSIKYEEGAEILTNLHKVLLNGKHQLNAVAADSRRGYVDLKVDYLYQGEIIEEKRKFGSVIIVYHGRELRGKGFGFE